MIIILYIKKNLHHNLNKKINNKYSQFNVFLNQIYLY